MITFVGFGSVEPDGGPLTPERTVMNAVSLPRCTRLAALTLATTLPFALSSCGENPAAEAETSASSPAATTATADGSDSPSASNPEEATETQDDSSGTPAENPEPTDPASPSAPDDDEKTDDRTTSTDEKEDPASNEGSASNENQGTQSAESNAHTMLHFVPGFGSDASSVSTEGLEYELSQHVNNAVTCDGELSTEKSSTAVTCTTTAGEKWHAYAIETVNPDGYQLGVKSGVLYMSDPLPDNHTLLDLKSAHVLTALPFGSMYGQDAPISKEQLGEDTLTTLSSDDALGSMAHVMDDLTWKNVTCDGGLDMKEFKPTACTATTSDGAEWHLRVFPGTFASSDDGLLVSIIGPQDV